jgi:hypothetical protein
MRELIFSPAPQTNEQFAHLNPLIEALMSHQTKPFFPHRRRRDGTLQSICLKCLATIGISPSEEELSALDAVHFCSPMPSNEHSLADGRMTIPPRTSLRANISKLGDNDPMYAMHLISQKSDLFLRRTFDSWSEAERAIADLHLSQPFADNAASKFAIGFIQYGEFVETLEAVKPELLGFQIEA